MAAVHSLLPSEASESCLLASFAMFLGQAGVFSLPAGRMTSMGCEWVFSMFFLQPALPEADFSDSILKAGACCMVTSS